ncbi:MAG: hypothetical protein ACREML_11150, partial [Vulcanimicrobiaceae bacterium]
MLAQVRRSRAVRIADGVLVPIRAIFMGPSSSYGLTSLRDERMWQVAQVCCGRVLDVGCGPGNRFIKKHIGE